MKNDLKKICVFEKTPIQKVLLKIEKNGKNGVFVTNKKDKLIGIIMDSDIRKSILNKKFSKIKFAKDLMKKRYLSINYNLLNHVHKLLLKSSKILIPIIKNGKLYDFSHIDEINLDLKKNQKKVLIIGGFGFIGSILTVELLKLGYEINILDKNLYGNPLKNLKLNKKIKFFIGSCDSKVLLKKSIEGCSHVIHLGEIVGDPAVAHNEKLSIQNNYEATNTVINECIKNNIQKFIFASSCSVYGFSEKICNEKSKLNPVSLYAKCKVACEQQILSHNLKSFSPTILRLSTVYGDSFRRRFDLVVNRFVAFALKKKSIKVFGKLNWRPVVSVNDVVKAIILVLGERDKKKLHRKIYNLGSDTENYTIGQIAKIISIFTNCKLELKNQIEDRRSYKVSFSKIKKNFNFTAKEKLEIGVKKMIKKYKKLKINLSNPNYFNDKKIKILFKRY